MTLRFFKPRFDLSIELYAGKMDFNRSKGVYFGITLVFVSLSICVSKEIR